MNANGVCYNLFQPIQRKIDYFSALRYVFYQAMKTWNRIADEAYQNRL